MSRLSKQIIIFFISLGVIMPASFSHAYWVNGVCYPDNLETCYYQNTYSKQTISTGINTDPMTHVCGSLAIVGLGCGAIPQTTYVYQKRYSADQVYRFYGLGQPYTVTPNPTLTTSTTETFYISSNETGLRRLSTASIFSGLFGSSSRASANPILVRAQGSTDVYEITNGQKHKVPNADIFNDYGYTAEMVREIPKKELDKYPRVSLIKQRGSSKIYYLTEAGLVREMRSEKVIESYGKDKKEAITVSRREFMFYPKNEFVYLESDPNKDVFQVVGKKKRYVTPVALSNLNIFEYQIAPVNDTEFKSYRLTKPLLQ